MEAFNHNKRIVSALTGTFINTIYYKYKHEYAGKEIIGAATQRHVTLSQRKLELLGFKLRTAAYIGDIDGVKMRAAMARI